ncbi:MAG: 50S ribosomal protein L9 [Verrucomicrobia bacterium]|jgi:large subunit ribosomal protein L9|nr:50S ribosomal protein L9 [Verrucomicrobiota bacterium]
MPKTEVILTQYVPHLGGESDQVKVAAGYARNYLLPQGLAVTLTGSNKRRLDALKQRRAEREGKELNAMTELAAGLSKLTLVITVKTGDDGKMFGSVTASTIAEELEKQYEAHLDKRKIHLLEPIRTIGEQEVELRLYQDINPKLKIRIESSTPIAPKPVEAPAPVRTSRGHRGEVAPDRGADRRSRTA